MSLPDGFLDELRDRVSLAQVAGRKVSWDQRKSHPGKGDYWAPCPFHQEKTASFHVDDRKGFYYCFGCHAKGNVYSFVQETENVGFMEAVEILANDAGMPMPARDPRAAEQADKRKTLTEVMELAVQFYRLQLGTAAGTAARSYLDGRKMAMETRDRFEIGFAPDDRQALFKALTAKGIKPEQLIEAGLCALPEDGGQPYDRFRSRIMFPIRDARGRAIAFGGRAMDPNARAKYLNSPETTLFDKGRTLFNAGAAREAAGKSGRLIVAEGYMDVIALAAAGFEEAVAPLGTAITEDQLTLMWRITDEPLIALDGDKAGLQAAYRLIDLSLPLLAPGKSLRFALMPQGQDPDDLIRSGGPAAMQRALDQSVPIVELLWRRETEDQVLDSPERRRALDMRLRRAIERIADQGLKGHYNQAIREKRAEAFQTKRQDQRPFRANAKLGRGARISAPASALTANSLLARGQGPEAEARIRESIILSVCLSHPLIAEKHEAELERAPFRCHDLIPIRDVVLGELGAGADGLASRVSTRLGYDAVEKLRENRFVRAHPHARADSDPRLAEITIAEEFPKLAAAAGLEEEIRDAADEITGVADEGLTWRLSEARKAQEKAARASLDGEGTQTEIGPNGLPISVEEKKRLKELTESIEFSRRSRK